MSRRNPSVGFRHFISEYLIILKDLKKELLLANHSKKLSILQEIDNIEQLINRSYEIILKNQLFP